MARSWRGTWCGCARSGASSWSSSTARSRRRCPPRSSPRAWTMLWLRCASASRQAWLHSVVLMLPCAMAPAASARQDDDQPADVSQHMNAGASLALGVHARSHSNGTHLHAKNTHWDLELLKESSQWCFHPPRIMHEALLSRHMHSTDSLVQHHMVLNCLPHLLCHHNMP